MNPFCKKEFPFFFQNKGTFLDNASTTQKPKIFFEAFELFLNKFSKKPEEKYIEAEFFNTTENLKIKIAKLIGCKKKEVYFTPQGSTFGINFVAKILEPELKQTDEILISNLEHHSNFLPWQDLAQKTNASFLVKDISQISKNIGNKTKILALTTESNVTGPVWKKDFQDFKSNILLAKKNDSYVFLDASQSIGYKKINFESLQADFLVFSAHKILGPTGLGVLISKQPLKIHNYETELFREIIEFEKTIDYFDQKKIELIENHCADLCKKLIAFLKQFNKVIILGSETEISLQGHLVSFYVNGINSHDFATLMGDYGVSLRAGNHCAQPLHDDLKIDSSVRASFFAYNDKQDLEKFEIAFKKTMNFFLGENYEQ